MTDRHARLAQSTRLPRLTAFVAGLARLAGLELGWLGRA